MGLMDWIVCVIKKFKFFLKDKQCEIMRMSWDENNSPDNKTRTNDLNDTNRLQ